MENTPFGRYRLVELLGRGGMGEVWRAYDTAANNRTVAIKLLPRHLASDDTFVQRFRREAEVAAQLSNKHVIPIHNYGEIDGQLYVDMRLIEGRDLQSVLADGPLPAELAVRIIEQVAKALQAAHKAGLVHRDVKPSNVLLDEDNDAYLIDFGIALGADQSSLTQTGTMIGSWHYMAPERFRGQDVDGRVDIYALACVLYECLTGARPFVGDTFESQATAHLAEPPPLPSATRPQIPTTFDAVIAKGMAKDLNQRYATAGDFAAVVRAAGEGTSTPSSFWSTQTGTWAPAEQHEQVEKPSRKTKHIALIGGITAVVMVVCLAIVVGVKFMPGNESGHSTNKASPNPATSAANIGSHGSAATAAESSYKVDVSFTQVGDTLNVRLRNPNPDVGLVRSPFELAMIDETGAVIGTEGQGGLPGAPINTIYQLPPGGEFGLNSPRVPSGKTVSSVELTVLGPWLKWDTVHPPVVAMTDEALLADTGYSGPEVTGRLTVDQDGPYNVVVIAFVNTSVGTVVSDVYVDCTRAGQNRTFQTKSFDDARGPYELDKIVAYTTAVKGAGPQSSANC